MFYAGAFTYIGGIGVHITSKQVLGPIVVITCFMPVHLRILEESEYNVHITSKQVHHQVRSYFVYIRSSQVIHQSYSSRGRSKHNTVIILKPVVSADNIIRPLV